MIHAHCAYNTRRNADIFSLTQLHLTHKTSDVFWLIKLCLNCVYLYFLLHHFYYIPDIPVCNVSSFLLVCSSVMDFCVRCILFCLLCECHHLSCILCTCKKKCCISMKVLPQLLDVSHTVYQSVTSIIMTGTV